MNTRTRDPEANARHQRAYRDRQRGGPPRTPKGCGTHAAFERHKRDGVPTDEIDEACRAAHNEYMSLSRFIRITNDEMNATDDPDELAALLDHLDELEAKRAKVR